VSDRRGENVITWRHPRPSSFKHVFAREYFTWWQLFSWPARFPAWFYKIWSWLLQTSWSWVCFPGVRTLSFDFRRRWNV